MATALAGAHGWAMTDSFRLEPVRVWSSALASLAPWLALLVAATLADDEAHVSGMLAAAPFYLAFVAVPAFGAIIAGRSWATRVVVTAVMTVVAAGAGVSMATSDDAQAGLAVLWVPVVAVDLAALVLVLGAVVRRREHAAGVGGASSRLAALLIDAVVIAAMLQAPLQVLSDAVAASLVSGALATVYLASFVTLAGGTPGQMLTGLTVVDHATGRLVPLGRALLRSVVVVVEVALAMSVLAPLVIAELAAATKSGRSLTDRLFGTAVLVAG